MMFLRNARRTSSGVAHALIVGASEDRERGVPFRHWGWRGPSHGRTGWRRMYRGRAAM